MEGYELELEKAESCIKEKDAKAVLVQLPDGLKPKAKEIYDHLEKNTSAKIIIWLAGCYGACDTPDVKGIDLLIQWGHSEWEY